MRHRISLRCCCDPAAPSLCDTIPGTHPGSTVEVELSNLQTGYLPDNPDMTVYNGTHVLTQSGDPRACYWMKRLGTIEYDHYSLPQLDPITFENLYPWDADPDDWNFERRIVGDVYMEARIEPGSLGGNVLSMGLLIDGSSFSSFEGTFYRQSISSGGVSSLPSPFDASITRSTNSTTGGGFFTEHLVKYHDWLETTPPRFTWRP